MYDTRLLPSAAAFAAAAWLSGAAAADETALGSNLPGLLAHAEAHSPELRALSLEHQAAEARAAATGRLEDPALEIERRDVSEIGSTRYLLTQTLPFWGKRSLGREVARSEASGIGFERDDRRAELRRRITESYTRYWHAAQSLQVLAELDETLGALEELARTRYASALAPQQDAIKATVERSELVRRRFGYETQLGRSASTLNALLGRAIDAPLAAPREPPPPAPPLPPLERLASRLAANHPALAARRAAAQSAELSERLVRRKRYPDLTLGVAPIQRENASDTWDAMLAFRLPLQQGRYRAEEREARLRHEAAEARREATETELLGLLASAWAEQRAADREAALLRSTLLAQTETNYRSALAGYQVAAVDFTTLLEALRQWHRSRLDLLEAEERIHILTASIERLTGETR